MRIAKPWIARSNCNQYLYTLQKSLALSAQSSQPHTQAHTQSHQNYSVSSFFSGRKLRIWRIAFVSKNLNIFLPSFLYLLRRSFFCSTSDMCSMSLFYLFDFFHLSSFPRKKTLRSIFDVRYGLPFNFFMSLGAFIWY
jgi:hypothetical protein